MSEADLPTRTKQFALRVMKLADAFPRTRSGNIVGNQIVRAATSVGANYRATQRARSHADFLYKLGVVEEEVDECCYWLEILAESGLVEANRLAPLLAEANELTAIIVASIRTAKKRKG